MKGKAVFMDEWREKEDTATRLRHARKEEREAEKNTVIQDISVKRLGSLVWGRAPLTPSTDVCLGRIIVRPLESATTSRTRTVYSRVSSTSAMSNRTLSSSLTPSRSNSPVL